MRLESRHLDKLCVEQRLSLEHVLLDVGLDAGFPRHHDIVSFRPRIESTEDHIREDGADEKDEQE
jgi:hypothetical protein